MINVIMHNPLYPILKVLGKPQDLQRHRAIKPQNIPNEVLYYTQPSQSVRIPNTKLYGTTVYKL